MNAHLLQRTSICDEFREIDERFWVFQPMNLLLFCGDIRTIQPESAAYRRHRLPRRRHVVLTAD